MVERASRVMARDRRRLASLENLSAWQEAARRHAHEMRTPLTAARLELARMRELLEDGGEGEGDRREELLQVRESLDHDLERLGRFTEGFTSFGRLPRPKLRRRDLADLTGEFVDLFASAWPNLGLELRRAPAPAGGFLVDVDSEMLRQVLVNLCDNSSLAIGGRPGGPGRMVLHVAEVEGMGVALSVADDGPGIAEEVRPRLFEPYTTSRPVGEGMGLGLAISRKILLDHGGDLELLESSAAGTTFRLLFPGIGEESPETDTGEGAA
jgi:nitrogen fixation/metabolism regulation signal transduction histidine kinase